MSYKVAFYTLGCKLNFSETSAIGDQFLQNGFNVVEFEESQADAYVINTCTVTENAEKDCRQIVRRALRQNPNAFIVVTGCYAQLRAEQIAAIDGVDVVLGSNEKFNILNYIDDLNKKELSCIHVSPTDELNIFHSSYSNEGNSRTRAFFKIQDGCDYKCSFCTIPLARGKSRSMNPEQVISEFKELLKAGYKEIILTGVNVGDYGSNTEFSKNLFELLLNLVKIEGEFRIRISSIEPNLLTDEIINLTAENSKMCNHFHIPLQSGSSKILKLMQRRYKADDYKRTITNAVSKIKDLAIGVDVIVGFPGETEEDFLETYNFLKELPISYLHVFTYSERPDTKAIDMNGSVDFAERKKRNKMLRILSEKKRSEFYRNMKDNELEILFEETNNEGFMKGFASNYVRVIHPYNNELVNKFTKVKIGGIDRKFCTAQLINDPIKNVAV